MQSHTFWTVSAILASSLVPNSVNTWCHTDIVADDIQIVQNLFFMHNSHRHQCCMISIPVMLLQKIAQTVQNCTKSSTYLTSYQSSAVLTLWTFLTLDYHWIFTLWTFGHWIKSVSTTKQQHQISFQFPPPGSSTKSASASSFFHQAATANQLAVSTTSQQHQISLEFLPPVSSTKSASSFYHLGISTTSASLQQGIQPISC